MLHLSPTSDPRTAARALAQKIPGVSLAEERPDITPFPPTEAGWGQLVRLEQKNSSLLSEWLCDGEGTGVAAVVWDALQTWSRATETVVLIEGRDKVCPAGLESWGFDRHRTVLVRPSSESERSWAIEQSLRCPGAGSVVAWVDRAPEQFLRRLQLAVEQGGSKGFLIRPKEARREKCWGDARFLVHPRPSKKSDLDDGRRRVEIEVLAGRGGIAVAGQKAIAEICDATGSVRLVPRLADPATARRTVGA